MSRLAFIAAVLGIWLAGAAAQPLAPAPVPPDAKLEQRLDAQLPLSLPFTDSQGRPLALGELFGQRPVLLVPGYYRCPQLCGLLMHGLLQALQHSGLPRGNYRIVRVSLDPSETPADARLRRDADLAYAALLADGKAPALDLHLLTGDEAALHSLARMAGVHYALTPEAADPAARYAHPAAVIVATPEGRISSYQMGVQFEPAALRQALVTAGQGRIGSLADRIALMCAHFDARLGRHSEAVLWLLRAVGVALMLALVGAWWWPQRPARRLPP